MNRIVLILIVAVCMAACSHHDQANVAKTVRVNVQEVSFAQGMISHEYAGTVEESFSASLSFGTSGRVEAVYVKEGQHVQAGQLLAKVDNTVALNSYRAAKASLDQAQDGYDRAKQVHDKGGLPDVKWTEVQIQLERAQSLAEIARKTLSDCELRAPTAGTISDRRLEKGSSVTAFQPVMNLVGLDGLYVKTSVPEGDINGVKTGAKALVKVGKIEVSGNVEERNPTADPITHSYSVRIRLNNAPKDLLPGMVCQVRMVGDNSLTGEMGKHAEIASRAVQIDNEGKRYVWVVEDGKAVQRYVTIADLSKNGVLVSEGLQQGDKVIVDGMLKVTSGTNVEYQQ